MKQFWRTINLGSDNYYDCILNVTRDKAAEIGYKWCIATAEKNCNGLEYSLDRYIELSTLPVL